MRKAKTSSKLSPISSTARTTLVIQKPFITISCTIGGYSSTGRIGVGVSSHFAAAGEAAAAEATEGATAVEATSGILASLATFALDVGRDATAYSYKQPSERQDLGESTQAHVTYSKRRRGSNIKRRRQGVFNGAPFSTFLVIRRGCPLLFPMFKL
jgi:hypothetical protein